jgi:transposase
VRTLLRFGHTVRLMAPQFVKPYVKKNKIDVADAEAICEAVIRPNMRFVPIKNIEQVVDRSAQAPASEYRCGGAGQQERAHRVGNTRTRSRIWTRLCADTHGRVIRFSY